MQNVLTKVSSSELKLASDILAGWLRGKAAVLSDEAIKASNKKMLDWLNDPGSAAAKAASTAMTDFIRFRMAEQSIMRNILGTVKIDPTP